MKKYTIESNKSIEDSIKSFNKYGVNTMVVISEDNKYLGTLTNGDIRRGILKTKSIKTSIAELYNKNSTFFYKGNYDVKKLRTTFIKNGFDLIPIVDDKMKLIKTIKIFDLFQKKIHKQKNTYGINAIIMAGGLGSRMAPFTDVLPKPLIPLKGKPVLNHIIENFNQAGINKCFVTLNYKSELLKSYLKETKFYSNLSLYTENKRLGTVGSAKNLRNKISRTVILTNCDTIINTNYDQLVKFHKNNSFDITIVSAIKEYNVPYGVCKTDEKQNFIELEEKPDLRILINSGMYVINRNIFNLIPQKKYDMNQLIEKAKKQGKKIGVYPISSDDWIDVGNWNEYSKVISNT